MAIPSRLLDGVVLTFIKKNTLYSRNITDRVKMDFFHFLISASVQLHFTIYQLKLIKKASNLSCQLTADGKAIKYKGSKPYENFIKNNSKKNFLLADSTEGNITIK